MGTNMKRSVLSMNPALVVLIRRLIVIPSMLLISMFCIWTLCELVAFSFSQQCAGQECTALSSQSLREVVVLARALNLENSEQAAPVLIWTPSMKQQQEEEEADYVSQEGANAAEVEVFEISEDQEGFSFQTGGRKMAEELVFDATAEDDAPVEENLEETVASLEHAEADNGHLQTEQDGASILEELKSLGYRRPRRMNQEEESRRRRMKEEAAAARANESVPATRQDASSIAAPAKEHSKKNSQGMKISYEPITGTDESTREEDAKQEERRIIGDGLQRIMNNLREYASSANATSMRSINMEDGDSCKGKWIYSYNLPPKFNTDLVGLCETLVPWYPMCDYFENSGLGKFVTGHKAEGILKPLERWHETNQYMLEVVFHARLREYPCLTDDPHKARLFHIPFYGGIDVLRYHYANVSFEKKDELGMELVGWLGQHESWHRNGGRDHFLVLGKITWDFRRNETDWGNTLLMFPELQNVSRLLIERDPWHENDIGVPHPTYFHPRSDSHVDTWLEHVRSSRRDRLVSFAGMPRTTDNIRSILIRMCLSHPILCRFLECSGVVCFRPEATMSLFLRSHFCLQPVGDSATRRSVFDSLVAGCIPVLLSKNTAYVQYPWHLPDEISAYSVYIPSEDVKAGKVDVVKVLARIPKERRQRMRAKIIDEVIPRLVYAAPGSNLSRYEDAFDVSIRSLLEKSRRIHAGLV